MADNFGNESKRIKVDETLTASTEIYENHHPYYLTNFISVLQSVMGGADSHVITSSYQLLLDKFNSIESNAQCLLMRLYLRKHNWIRVDKLSYPAISEDLSPLLVQLVDKGLIDNESNMQDPNEMLNLLQISELKQICKQMNFPPSVSNQPKHQCISSMLAYCRQHKSFLSKVTPLDALIKLVKKALRSCVRVSLLCIETFSRVFALFSLTNGIISTDGDTTPSGIIYQMHQVNTGKVVYPQYTCIITRPLFITNEDFERYFSAIQLEERIVTFISDKSIVPLEVSKIAEKAMEILSLEQSRDLYENDTFSKGSPKTTTTKDNIIDLTDDDDGGDDGGYIYSCSEPSVTFWSHFTAGYVCVQVLIYCVECYEKLRDYKRANELLVLCLSQDKYSHRRRGKWWERLILNLHYHLNQPNQCLSQIKVALEDPTIYDSTRYSLLVRAHKICSSTNLKKSIKYSLNDFPPITIKQQPEIFITGIQQPNTPYFIVQDGDTSSLHSVEGFAIHHYTKVSKWPKGLHLEGICFSSLYMLLMWDAIFTHEVPDVFRGPYQSIPLDFGGSGFYHTRKKLIDPLIEMVKSFSLQELSLYITSKWTEHFGETVMGINWDAFPNGSDDLVEIAVCIGTKTLSEICQLYSQDYYRNRSGLPDLTLWDPIDKQCKFVEVKGPGDTLSNKQIVWLSKLADLGHEVEVCRVKAVRS